MKFKVITIFPQMIEDYKKISLVARAIAKKMLKIEAINLRDFTSDNHQTVDGRPYGGGFGMVLKADVMQKAIKKAVGVRGKGSTGLKKTRVLMMTPSGKVFSQAHARRLAEYENIVFVCGRYEGFDERISSMVDEEFSIGDYILMGGELPALVMIETISRFLPGIIGKTESIENESFSAAGKDSSLLEHPQYTRPEVLKVGLKNMRVPKVLLSGNHADISKWRADQSVRKTKKKS